MSIHRVPRPCVHFIWPKICLMLAKIAEVLRGSHIKRCKLTSDGKTGKRNHTPELVDRKLQQQLQNVLLRAHLSDWRLISLAGRDRHESSCKELFQSQVVVQDHLKQGTLTRRQFESNRVDHTSRCTHPQIYNMSSRLLRDVLSSGHIGGGLTARPLT